MLFDFWLRPVLQNLYKTKRKYRHHVCANITEINKFVKGWRISNVTSFKTVVEKIPFLIAYSVLTHYKDLSEVTPKCNKHIELSRLMTRYKLNNGQDTFESIIYDFYQIDEGFIDRHNGDRPVPFPIGLCDPQVYIPTRNYELYYIPERVRSAGFYTWNDFLNIVIDKRKINPTGILAPT